MFYIPHFVYDFVCSLRFDLPFLINEIIRRKIWIFMWQFYDLDLGQFKIVQGQTSWEAFYESHHISCDSTLMTSLVKMRPVERSTRLCDRLTDWLTHWQTDFVICGMLLNDNGGRITLAMRNPSEKSIISQICCMSGTMTTTGRNRDLTDSGNSVRPA